jgi:glucose/arabinose dehydrogenase
MVMAGCSPAAPVTTDTPVRSAPATNSSAAPTSAPASATATLNGCPSARRESQLPVLAHLDIAPDDVIVDSAGDIWVTALAAHRITELSAAGHVIATVGDAGGPEGIAALPDGRFVVADQQSNALSVFTPGDKTVSALVALTNHTANAGVDGIDYDAVNGRLLIPDSPNGTLLSYAVGGAITELRHGLGRPVAASTDPTGDTYIGMENPPGVLMTAPSGTARSLGSFQQVDEVVYLNGLLYVADLAGTVDAIDPASGRSATLVVAAPAPQGLAATAAGDLVLVDETTRLVAAVAPCR